MNNCNYRTHNFTRLVRFINMQLNIEYFEYKLIVVKLCKSVQNMNTYKLHFSDSLDFTYTIKINYMAYNLLIQVYGQYTADQHPD